MRLIIRLLIIAAAMWVAAEIVGGMDLEGSALEIAIVVLVFGAVNVFLKPILKMLSLPVVFLTLGLFTLIINTGLLALTAAVTDALSIDGFVPAFLGALVISIVSAVLNFLVPDKD